MLAGFHKAQINGQGLRHLLLLEMWDIIAAVFQSNNVVPHVQLGTEAVVS